MRRLLLLVVLALSVPVPSGAATRTQTKPYVGDAVLTLGMGCYGTGPILFGTADDPYGIGGNCFELEEGETSISFVVEDDVSPASVGGAVFFLDGAGNYITDTLTLYCDGGTRVVPEGAVYVTVEVDNASTVSACFNGSPGAVAGKITLTFRAPDAA